MKRQSLILLCGLLLVNCLILFGQSAVAFWKWRGMPGAGLMTEPRYYVQCFVLLLPLIPFILLRLRHGQKILCILVAALAVHALVFLVKAQIPGTRRNQYLAACDWAVEKIRADYKGPKRDAEPFFSQYEYHLLERPAVESHTKRVAYLLGGRRASPMWCWPVDTPDYIVDERNRLNRDFLSLAEYETLAERKFGKRDFIIYKRVK